MAGWPDGMWGELSVHVALMGVCLPVVWSPTMFFAAPAVVCGCQASDTHAQLPYSRGERGERGAIFSVVPTVRVSPSVCMWMSNMWM